jgi:hypothetical protein
MSAAPDRQAKEASMKKYFIAGALAIIVFAISAFAASLTVNGGVLQAGSGSIEKCTQDIVVTYGEPYKLEGAWVVDKLTLDTTDGEGCGSREFRAVVTADGADLSNIVRGQFFGGIAADVQFEPFDAISADGVDVIIWDTSSSE